MSNDPKREAIASILERLDELVKEAVDVGPATYHGRVDGDYWEVGQFVATNIQGAARRIRSGMCEYDSGQYR